MKAGTTFWLSVKTSELDMDYVSEVIFTVKSRKHTISKQGVYENGYFKIPFSQEETIALKGSCLIEGQINFTNKSVAKTETKYFNIDETLATKIIDGNYPADNETNIELDIDGTLVHIGGSGNDGVGIESIEQTTTSEESGGINIITVTLTTGEKSEFTVRNGEQGTQGPQGAQGPQGEQGITGKSAYAYAVDGGYEGTEEDFAQKLAAEEIIIDDALSEKSENPVQNKVVAKKFTDLSGQIVQQGKEIEDIGTIKTVKGTSVTVTDAIDGKVISCVGESDVTVSGINICSIKELSGVGQALGSFGTMIPAGTYTLTAEVTTNNPDITKARVFIGAFPKNIVCDGTRQFVTYNITRDIVATLNAYASDSTTVTEYSISLSNIVITKGSSPSEYEPCFEPITYNVDNLNSIELTENTNIITSDSEFELRYVQRNAYVESLLSSIDVGVKMYVTPEDFGAYGDGFADDTSALNTCIAYAIEQSIPVRGYGKYKTTAPINIIGNKVDLHIYQIEYLGNDSAVVYQGLNSFITIQKITSKGTGLYIKAETSNTYYNTFTVNEITAEKNGVHVHAIKNAYQNQLYFNIIKSKGEYSCILFERDENTDNGYCAEWTIKGGYLTGGLWGIRGWMSSSTSIDVHTENLGTDGNGGAIFADNGQIPKIIWARSGEIILCNTWLKLSGIFKKPQTVQINRIFTTLEAIDISELEVDTDIETRSDNIQAFTEIEVQKEKQSNILLTKNLILWGNRFQFPPVRYIRLDVASDIDMTPQYYKDGIPQCFVAKADATINLHPTYAANCLNTFEIVQEECHKLTVKDYVGNVVFDGTQYNDGRYRLTAYVSGDVPLQYDMGNQLWEILEL